MNLNKNSLNPEKGGAGKEIFSVSDSYTEITKQSQIFTALISVSY